jgi:hypothetical protein
MPPFSESVVEDAALEWLAALGLAVRGHGRDHRNPERRLRHRPTAAVSSSGLDGR